MVKNFWLDMKYEKETYKWYATPIDGFNISGCIALEPAEKVNISGCIALVSDISSGNTTINFAKGGI